MRKFTKPPESKEEKLKLRNERIRNDFKKYTGAPHHKSADYVVEVILADSYLPLENETIWRIIKKQGDYKL